MRNAVLRMPALIDGHISAPESSATETGRGSSYRR